MPRFLDPQSIARRLGRCAFVFLGIPLVVRASDRSLEAPRATYIPEVRYSEAPASSGITSPDPESQAIIDSVVSGSLTIHEAQIPAGGSLKVLQSPIPLPGVVYDSIRLNLPGGTRIGGRVVPEGSTSALTLRTSLGDQQPPSLDLLKRKGLHAGEIWSLLARLNSADASNPARTSPGNESPRAGWVAGIQKDPRIRWALSERSRARYRAFEAYAREHPSDKASNAFMRRARLLAEPYAFVIEPYELELPGEPPVGQGPAFYGHPIIGVAGPAASGEDLEAFRHSSYIRLEGFEGRFDRGGMKIKAEMDVDRALESDVFGTTLAHEVFHGIMYDLVGDRFPSLWSLSTHGHDTDRITDPEQALVEGFGELAEALLSLDTAPGAARGSTTHPGEPAQAAEDITILDETDLAWGRRAPVAGNKFIEEDYDTVTDRPWNGRIKTGAQMLACEGVVATILFRLLGEEIDGSAAEYRRDQLYRVLLEVQPRNIAQLVEGWAELYPVDRRRVITIFLKTTCFATISTDARQKFMTYSRAWLDWKDARDAGAHPSIVQEAQESFRRSETRYLEMARGEDGLIQQALQGRIGLLQETPVPVWLAYQSEGGELQRIDVNTVTSEQLRILVNAQGFQESEIVTILDVRDQRGGFPDIDALAGALTPTGRTLVVALSRFAEESLPEVYHTIPEAGAENQSEPEDIRHEFVAGEPIRIEGSHDTGAIWEAQNDAQTPDAGSGGSDSMDNRDSNLVPLTSRTRKQVIFDRLYDLDSSTDPILGRTGGELRSSECRWAG